jgi:hypothetical protein
MLFPQLSTSALSSYPNNITPLLLWNLQKCPHCHQHFSMLKEGVIMLHNKAWTVQDICNEKCCSISYNLDISLSAFHVLNTLKNALNGHSFGLNKNIKAGIWQQPRAFLVNKIHQLMWKGNAALVSVGTILYYTILLHAEKSPGRFCLNKPHTFHLVLR